MSRDPGKYRTPAYLGPGGMKCLKLKCWVFGQCANQIIQMETMNDGESVGYCVKDTSFDQLDLTTAITLLDTQ